MVIRNWHICISGFLQKSGRPTGMMNLWRKLRFLSAPETEVILMPWKMDVWSLAETIWLTGDSGESEVPKPASRASPLPFAVIGDNSLTSIYIYAYSWGAGWGATRLINQLRNRGLRVSCCIFSDPVFRSPYLPDSIPFNPSTWFGRYPVRINDNVDRVKWFYQVTNKPHGHDVIKIYGDEQPTIIEPGIELHGVTHQYMDDAPSFHSAAIKVARESLII